MIVWTSRWPPLVANAFNSLCTHFRSEEHTSELQSLRHLVCHLLLEKKKYRVRHVVQSNMMNRVTIFDTQFSMTLRFAGYALSTALVMAIIIVGLYVAGISYLYHRTD